MVGSLCALLSNVAVVMLVRCGLGSITASVVAFGPVLLVGYALHSLFTFGTQPSRLTFARYTLATLANFPIWASSLYVFCDLLKCPVELVAPAVTAFIFLWNYVSSRWAFLGDGVSRVGDTARGD